VNIVPSQDSPEVTLAESAKAAAADAALLAAGIPGDDPALLALMADRLSEELAETGLMLRALPGRPAEGISGHDHQLLAGLRSAHAAGEDLGETLGRALARLAAELGGIGRVTSNRPGSWEASLVDQLARGTAGGDSYLDEHRATR
jgi:hypothetical protein